MSATACWTPGSGLPPPLTDGTAVEGKRLVLRPADTIITVTAGPSRVEVRAQAFDSVIWGIQFSAASGHTLAPGMYELARLIDSSPLYKYLVSGPDARRLVDRIVTRDMKRVNDLVRMDISGLIASV